MKGIVLIIFLFFFAIPVGFFVWLLIKGLRGAKSDEWEGEVVDKIFNINEDEGVTHEYYSIVFKTDKGQRKIAVNKRDYGNWKVGDKARKIKNKFGVEKYN